MNVLESNRLTHTKRVCDIHLFCEAIMNRKLVVLSLLQLFVLTSAAYGQAKNEAASAEEIDLAAFLSISAFSDRGMAAVFIQPVAEPVAETAAPPDLLELLDLREKNLAKESRELPWPLQLARLTPAPGKQGEVASKAAAVNEFRKYGVVALFFHENTKLLDSPLTERKELMKRFKQIADDFANQLSAPFARQITQSEWICISATLRKLSADLDDEIVKALSPAEIRRVAKLASYLLPSVIADAKEANRQYSLGSAVANSLDYIGKKEALKK